MKKLKSIIFYKFQDRHFVTFALICAVCIQALGEDYGPQDYSIVPPAPQVEALMDFKEYPVDYFHGSPQINFNIYTLKVGQISVPITLSYHSGGLRVNQKAGNAGLGWSVNCGATISHTVYGAPDAANGGTNKINGLFNLSNDEKLFRQKLIEKKLTMILQTQIIIGTICLGKQRWAQIII